MNHLTTFLDACRKANGNPVSLRSVFPGRGRLVTEQRKDVRRAIEQGPVDGVELDRVRGVFVFTGAKS